MIPAYLIEEFKPGHLVQHYLLASYAYYIRNESPMEDAAFDRLCARLLEEFDTFDHPHKHLIDREMLAAGSGFNLAHEDYPTIVSSGVIGYIAKCFSGEMVRTLEAHFGVTAPVRPARVLRRPPSRLPAPPVQSTPPPPRRVGRTPVAVAKTPMPLPRRITRTR